MRHFSQETDPMGIGSAKGQLASRKYSNPTAIIKQCHFGTWSRFFKMALNQCHMWS